MAFNIVASLFAGTMAIISGFGAEAGAEVVSTVVIETTGDSAQRKKYT